VLSEYSGAMSNACATKTLTSVLVLANDGFCKLTTTVDSTGLSSKTLWLFRPWDNWKSVRYQRVCCVGRAKG
jgi:hypothetical protein